MYGSVFHSFQFLFSFSKPVLWTWVMLLSGEGHGNPPKYSCLENPVDRGAWWAAVHGIVQSWTRLKRLSMHACIGEGNDNPLQYSCLENPRDRGAWWAAVYGSHKVRHDVRDLAAAAPWWARRQGDTCKVRGATSPLCTWSHYLKSWRKKLATLK